MPGRPLTDACFRLKSNSPAVASAKLPDSGGRRRLRHNPRATAGVCAGFFPEPADMKIFG